MSPTLSIDRAVALLARAQARPRSPAGRVTSATVRDRAEWSGRRRRPTGRAIETRRRCPSPRPAHDRARRRSTTSPWSARNSGTSAAVERRAAVGAVQAEVLGPVERPRRRPRSRRTARSRPSASHADDAGRRAARARPPGRRGRAAASPRSLLGRGDVAHDDAGRPRRAPEAPQQRAVRPRGSGGSDRGPRPSRASDDSPRSAASQCGEERGASGRRAPPSEIRRPSMSSRRQPCDCAIRPPRAVYRRSRCIDEDGRVGELLADGFVEGAGPLGRLHGPARAAGVERGGDRGGIARDRAVATIMRSAAPSRRLGRAERAVELRERPRMLARLAGSSSALAERRHERGADVLAAPP